MATNRLAHRTHVENWFEEFERSFENTQDEMRRNRQSSHQAESVRVPPATAFRRELESKPILGDPIGGEDEDTIRVFHIRKKRWNATFVTAALLVAILIGVGVGMIPNGSAKLSEDELRRLLIPDVQEPSESQLKALSWLFDEDNVRSDQDEDVLKERFALVSLYFATGGDTWTKQLNFLNVSSSVCTWNSLGREGDSTDPGQLGVYCQDGSASHIFLAGNNLQGTLPMDLGLLSLLSGFYFSNNALTGKLPSEIGLLHSLRAIWAKQNSLTGTIPSEITVLPKLTRLSLYGNDLRGPIPKQMSPSIVELSLQQNELSGTIPPEWGDLSDLEKLSLASNEIGGSIPSALGNLQKLTQLRLGSNVLTGSIPSELFALPDLTVLEVAHNYIEGDLNDVFCSQDQATRSMTVRADCAGDNPKVQCSCCTCS